MNSDKSLEQLNSVLVKQNMSLQFSSADEIKNLSYEHLSFLFYKLSRYSAQEGVDPSGNLNEMGLLYDDVCTYLSLEMMNRPEFQFDDPSSNNSTVFATYEKILDKL